MRELKLFNAWEKVKAQIQKIKALIENQGKEIKPNDLNKD